MASDKVTELTSFYQYEEVKDPVVGFEYLTLGVPPHELTHTSGDIPFDFGELVNEFKKVCPDYDDEASWSSKSNALAFSQYVLFKLGPDARSVRETGIDKMYKLRFPHCINNETEIFTVIVRTYKYCSAPKVAPKVKNKVLELTVKQASLLAVSCLSKIVDVCHSKGRIILTPLAGAIFSRNDIKKIYEEITNMGYETTIVEIIRAIIESCQNGGHYLHNSQACIAVAASICATQELKDDKLRKQIIGNTRKQYQAAGKQFDPILFKVYMRCASGYIPPECLPEVLIAEFERIRVSRQDDDMPTTSKKAYPN